MNFRIAIEQEEDGSRKSLIYSGSSLMGAMVDAKTKIQALALRVVADRLQDGEAGPDLVTISFAGE
jgi:hypothetical protein